MPKRILYLESVAGIAGDMFSAAFLDAGLVPEERIRAVPSDLGYKGVEVEIHEVQRANAQFTRVRVVGPGGSVEGEHLHSGTASREAQHHRHYHYPALVRQLEESSLDATAKAFALQVFRLLAEAEGASHGVPLEKVAFHEVGAVDSVVDVAMAGVCVSAVRAEVVLSSPVKLGRGTIRIQHGTYPVPPPASARLSVGMPLAPVPEVIQRADVELSTPTGLAILRALEPEFVEGWPGGTLLAQGSGAGNMDLGDYPNIFRVALLEVEEPLAAGAGAENSPLPYERDRVVEIRCNLDDQTGERLAWLTERAMRMGALDAWISPAVGKKGRPMSILTILSPPEAMPSFSDFLLRYSSTFGVRYAPWDRLKLVRDQELRDTTEGPVRFKVGRTREGEWLKEKPEFEDLKKIWDRDPGFQP